MNLRTLYNNSKSISEYRSHYKMPADPHELVDISPNFNSGEICFIFECPSITSPAMNHLTFIAFRNTHFITNETFEEEQLPENRFYSFSYKGDLYWAKKHKLTNTVRVACSCEDYYFTFAYWNWRRQCNFGKKPLPYIRKTTTYPERNPEHVSGFCKHIYWSLIELYELGIMGDLV